MTTKTQELANQKAAIQSLLATSNRAVERALYRIYQAQTASEQAVESTQENNGVGFTGQDAPFLTSCAKGMLKYGHLTERQIPVVRRKIAKYWRQLAAVAAANGRTIMANETTIRSEEDKRVALVTESEDDRAMDRMVQKGEADEAERVAQYKMNRDSAIGQIFNTY
jgi:hypothetical protein